MLRGFATVNYWADDLEAAKGWYAELLGVEPYFERSGYYEFRVGDYQRLVLARRRGGGGPRAVAVHGGEGVPVAHAMG